MSRTPSRDLKNAVNHLVVVGKMDQQQADDLLARLADLPPADGGDLADARADMLVAQLLHMFAGLDPADERRAVDVMQDIARRAEEHRGE